VWLGNIILVGMVLGDALNLFDQEAGGEKLRLLINNIIVSG
jgi:hypothetical protein